MLNIYGKDLARTSVMKEETDETVLSVFEKQKKKTKIVYMSGKMAV